MAINIDDLVTKLLEMETRQAAQKEEITMLRQRVSEMPATDMTDQLERAMLRVWSRSDDTDPPVEQRALMAWFGEMRERLGHSDPSFYLSVIVDPNSGDVQLKGPGLAFADAARIGKAEFELPVDARTVWRLKLDDVTDQGVKLPAEIVIFRGGRTVARGVLPAA